MGIEKNYLAIYLIKETSWPKADSRARQTKDKSKVYIKNFPIENKTKKTNFNFDEFAIREAKLFKIKLKKEHSKKLISATVELTGLFKVSKLEEISLID